MKDYISDTAPDPTTYVPPMPETKPLCGSTRETHGGGVVHLCGLPEGHSGKCRCIYGDCKVMWKATLPERRP